jgi:membrane-associated phospholipid phosphatase
VTAAGSIERFDRAVDELFDHLRGKPAADRVFYVASELGDFSLIWQILSTAQGAVRPDGIRRAVQLAAALGVESLLVNGVVKSAFRRARPVVEVERPHKLRVPRTTSFPSGHASSAFFAAALLSDRSRAWPAYYGVAGVVALSRVHVRIHHASDVVGGAILGAALGAVATRVLRGR